MVKDAQVLSIQLFSKENFPVKVHKISIHAGFTCPNRDGLVGVGGCTYCANESFSPNVRETIAPINEQVEDGIKFLKEDTAPKSSLLIFRHLRIHTQMLKH